MAEKLDLAKRPCTEHGVVERRDSLDGDFRPRGLMNCGSIRKSGQHVAPKAKAGEWDSHNDAVRAFSDDFYTAIVGCDFKVLHYGYLV